MSNRGRIAGACVMVALLSVISAWGDTNLVVTSFEDGVVTWTNVDTSLYYNVEWRPSLTGTNDWTSSSRGSQDLRGTNATMSALVPMFLRISGTSNALNSGTLSSGATAMDAGYYEAGDLATVDADLVSSNIRAGVTIFGVSGKTEVVDTTSGDATTNTVGFDKKAWVDGVEIAGHLAGGVSCSPTATYSSGRRWCGNGDGTVTDTTTGLIWFENASAYWGTYASCAGKISKMSSAATAALSDGSEEYEWRLPTVKEFRDATSGAEPLLASGSAYGLFINIMGASYWTCSGQATNSPSPFYIMRFLFPGLSVAATYLSELHYAFPVRSPS